MLESGWGTSSVVAVTNNLGNLKGRGPAGTTHANVPEYYMGRLYTEPSNFRKYHDLLEFLQDYAQFICKNKRYARAKGKIGRDFFQALKDAGYATDPNYVEKSMSIYNQLQ
jgi:peptidoglycan hydrolase FlgJ